MAHKPFAMHLHALPEGQSTISRLQFTAASMGYGTVVVGNHHDAPLPEGAILPITGLFRAVEVRADTASQLTRLVHGLRSEFDLLAVHGEEPSVVMAALKNKRIDLVSHPYRIKKGINHVLARLAAKNGVAFEFCYAPIIHLRGTERERFIRNSTRLLELQRRYGFAFVVAGGAWSHFDMRAPREVEALCATFGMEASEVRTGLYENPRALLERRTSKNWQGDGVFKCA